MSLYVVTRSGEQEHEWHVGEKWPKDYTIAATAVSFVQADGDELDAIMHARPSLATAKRVAKYYGDEALWVCGNIVNCLRERGNK